MTEREKLLEEFYNLIMRINYENGLCEDDRKRYEEIKKILLAS